MPRPRKHVPAYRLHKQSGQAIVTVNLNGVRKDYLLGSHGSPESKVEYRRILDDLEAGRLTADGPTDLTVNELCLRYWDWAETYYRNPDGSTTSELYPTKSAIEVWRGLYGHTPAREFGPLALKKVRDVMVGKGWCRGVVNQQCGRIKRIIRWAVENELVPADRWEALRAVRGLAKGRTEAPEPVPRKPADSLAFKSALPHLPPMLAAASRLIYLSGARPSEILRVRPCELDRSGEVWTLTPERHKGEWRGGSRILYLGPEAQSVLSPWLVKASDPEAYVFSPALAEAERNRQRSHSRVVKLWPSHARRNKAKRKGRQHKPYYDHDALCRALNRACIRAKVDPFTPYQLRHLRAVELREQFGLEHARAVLGHAYASMSDHYSKAADKSLAAAVALKIG